MTITPEALHFLTENMLHDSKTWHHEHKDQYQKLIMEPMLELTQQLIPTIAEIDPEILAIPRRCISRIYRDTRFSKDKTLYRDVVWCSFTRDQKRYDYPPALFFEFSPARIRYGCGFYFLPPSRMQLLRDSILRGDPLFVEAYEAYHKQDRFSLWGDCYKRPHYGDQPDHLRDWLERKELSFLRETRDFSLLFSQDLASHLQESFQMLAPMYRFLLQAAKPYEPDGSVAR